MNNRYHLLTALLIVAAGFAGTPSAYAQRSIQITELQRLTGTCGADGDDHLTKAIEDLEASREPGNWADFDLGYPHPNNGNKVFDADRDAVLELIEVLAKGTSCFQEAQAAIDFLVGADRDMAELELSRAEVECTTDGCMSDRDKAVERLADAEAQLTKGDLKRAIEGFRDAWEDAISAGRKRNKMDICHIPPGNPANRRTINISSRSVDTHLNKHGDHFGTCGFEGSGSSDLGIGTATADALKPAGDRIKHTVSLQNDGPDDGSNITVLVEVTTPGVFTSAVPSVDSEYDLLTGYWTIPWVEGGVEATLELEGVAQEELTVTKARITASDQPDANPNNNDTDAAPEARSSAGYDGGLESNGSLAAKIAARTNARRQALRAGRVAPPLRALSIANKQGRLSGFIPQTAAFGTTAFISTPEDLVTITNATDALAVDYIDPTGRRIGALLALETPAGSVYEHSKVICDRLVGAKLEAARRVRIDGLPFVLVQLKHEDGSIDYAVTLAIYEAADGMRVESRFRNADYHPPIGGSPVINLQVWSVRPDVTVGLVSEIIRSVGSVAAMGSDPAVPSVLVREAVYRAGRIELTVDNRSAATEVVLSGVRHDAEFALGTPLLERVSLAPNATSRLSVATGPLYDAGFTVDAGLGGVMDEVYVADGAWGASSDAGSSIERFEILPDDASEEHGLGRSVRLEGTVRTRLSIYRFLRPGARPKDLSSYRSLTITGSSSLPATLMLETTVDGRPSTVDVAVPLTAETASHRIDFGSLSAPAGWQRAVTQIALYVHGDGLQDAPVVLDIDRMRLEFSTSVGSDRQEMPTAAHLGAPYPNPFVSRFSVPVSPSEPGMLEANVYDALGRRVATVQPERVGVGTRALTIDGSSWPVGIYFVRVRSSGQASTATITRMR